MRRIKSFINQHNRSNPRFNINSAIMFKSKIFPVVLFLLASMASCEKRYDGPVPSITASVDRDRISVGDRIAYRVRSVVDKETPSLLKEYQGSIGPFTILNSDIRESVTGGRRIIDCLYTITAFTTGHQVIEPPVLEYGEDGKERLAASPIEIEVYSVLGENPELKDIKGPVDLEAPAGAYLLIGLAVVVAAAVLIFFYLRRREREKAPAPEIVVPPHELAYRELERIRAMNLIAMGKIKEYFTGVSDVLRKYLEGAFSVSAPEMTTEEFLDAAAASGVLTLGHRELLRDFLNQCDLVKFARYRATKEEADSVYAAARRFVDETAPADVTMDEGRGTTDENMKE